MSGKGSMVARRIAEMTSNNQASHNVKVANV